MSEWLPFLLPALWFPVFAVLLIVGWRQDRRDRRDRIIGKRRR